MSLVSIFTHKRGQVIASGLLENKKSSEIPKVKELIKALNLENFVFTLDACIVKKTVEEIVTSGNDYVIQVKENRHRYLIQSKLLWRIMASFYLSSRWKSRGRNGNGLLRYFYHPYLVLKNGKVCSESFMLNARRHVKVVRHLQTVIT